MKPARGAAVAWIVLLLGGPTRTPAQVPAEEVWWWEVMGPEGAHGPGPWLDDSELAPGDAEHGYDPGGHGWNEPNGGGVERGPYAPRGWGPGAPGGWRRPYRGLGGEGAWGWTRCGNGPPRGADGGRGCGPLGGGWGEGGWGRGQGWGPGRRPGPGGGFDEHHALDAHELEHLLGFRTLERLHRHAHAFGAFGLPRGRWVDLGPRGVVVQVRVGRLPLAELGDVDRDGRIDWARVNDGRGPGFAAGPARGPYPAEEPLRRRGSLFEPVLALRHAQAQEGGVRYGFSVPNWTSYAPELFRPAPDLPPCGLNRMSSRTWVDVFDGSGRRLYGFCALPTPQGLDGIWAFVPDGDPASQAYVILTDRLTGESVASNLVALR